MLNNIIKVENIVAQDEIAHVFKSRLLLLCQNAFAGGKGLNGQILPDVSAAEDFLTSLDNYAYNFY